MLVSRRRLFAAAFTGFTPALFPPALAKAPLAVRQAPGVYRFRVGAFEVTTVNDGMLNLAPTVFTGAPEGEMGQLLEAAALPRTTIPTAVNAFLVNTDERLVLIDAGTATAMGPSLGRLLINLAAAGIEPAAVDAVLLTHMHPDHAYGLLTAGGAAAFPNAEVVVAEPEFAFWSDDAMLTRAAADAKPFFEGARAAVKPYAARLRRFSADGEVVPGIAAVSAPGHTPGHTMYRVTSGDAALLVWGDLVHSAALQLPGPRSRRASTWTPREASRAVAGCSMRSRIAASW